MKKPFLLFVLTAMTFAGCGELTDTLNDVSSGAPDSGTEPAGGVSIEMSNGAVVWATANLSGYRTFADNAQDAGVLFQWGYDTAVASASTGGTVGVQTSVSTQAGWNPCPTGWRLPTVQEFVDLINVQEDGVSSYGYGKGKADGEFGYTTSAWAEGSGADKGLRIASSAPAPSVEYILHLPNAGYRTAGGQAERYGFTGRYWGVSFDGNFGHHLAFGLENMAGELTNVSKMVACSVRCVKTL